MRLDGLHLCMYAAAAGLTSSVRLRGNCSPPAPAHRSWLVAEPMLSMTLPTVSRGLSMPVLVATEPAQQAAHA